MKHVLFCFLLTLPLCAAAQNKKSPTDLRGVLLEQLRTTHDQEDWFVPASIAVAGLTADQAKWSPGKDAHSVGQLANHLLFWNTRELADFKGEKPQAFSGNNDETFNDFDAATWTKTVHDLDLVMTSLEDLVAHASDADLAKWAPTIAHIGTHNAYHIGQILYVRKLQGSWNPANGVK